MSPKKLRLALRTWHRRLGLFSAFVVILLCVTGLLLNHTDALRLDERYLAHDGLRALYGLPSLDVAHFELPEGRWLSVSSGKRVYLDAEPVLRCDAGFTGYALVPEGLLIGCAQRVAMLSRDGRLLDELTSSFGLPVPLSHFSECDSTPCFRVGAQSYTLDTLTFEFHPTDTSPVSISPGKAPTRLADQVRVAANGQGVHWERLLLDVHAGRFLGPLGPWILDLFALSFLALTLTGFWLWWKSPRKGR